MRRLPLMSINVVVTGSRDWPEEYPDLIVATLSGLYGEGTIGHLVTELSEFHLYVGDANGVDRIVKWWAEQSPFHSHNERHDDPVFEFHRFKADWNRYGKTAGPLRNTAMLEAAQHGTVLAFHQNKAVYLNLHRPDG